MADDFLIHYKTPVMKRPTCNTGFFIHVTQHPALVTCPACIEQIKYEQEKQDVKKRL
jgi:hypothetical protein